MTRGPDRTSRQAASRRNANGELRLTPVGRHGRAGLLRTTALRAVALFGLAATGAAGTGAAIAQPAPNARPQGGAVAGGAASIARTQTTTTVTQSSPRAAVDWSSFDVGANQTFVVTAPSPADVTLNRVTGPDPSQIAGHVVANDQLVIVNRNGVVFSKGAEVDTAGLVVSASGISTQTFMKGGMTFDVAPSPGAKVDNQGRISVRDRGLAALVAPQVANSGVITARMGHVVLAGAQTHTVDLYGDGMLSINVTGQVTKASLGGRQVDALVTNTGVVRADGGTVTLTAQAVDGLVTTLVSAGGKVSADTVGRRAGTVLVEGEGGSVRVTGELSAQGAAAGTQGGGIEVNATQVAGVASGARLDASGRAGGGVIAVGTTLARAQGGPSVKAARTARGVLVAQGATLSADATDAGAGGRITVLSTEQTSFAGALTARGGAASGDGGQAEISGGAGYSLTGAADLGSAHGARGSLLIDPTDLTVIATPPGDFDTNKTLLTTGVLLAAVTPGATVSAGVLNTIGLTTSLQLQATDNLTVNAAISVLKGLQLQAGNNLTVNSSLTAGGAISLSAGDASIAGFNFAGALTLNAAVSSLTGVTLLAGTGGISAQSVVNGPTVTMFSTGIVTLGAASAFGVGSGSGALGISAAGLTQSAGATITAGTLQSPTGFSGTVDLSAGANTIKTLGGISVTGDFKLADTSALDVVGAVAATGNLLVKVGSGAGGQALTFGNAASSGTLGAGNNGTVSVIADSVTVSGKGGGLTATGAGTIEIAPYTPGTAVAIGGASAAGTLGLPLASLTLSDGTGGTLRIGAAGGAMTAGAIVFGQALDATAFATLDLEAAGAVSQGAADGVKATLLTGTVRSLDFSAAAATNAVAAVGALTATAGNVNLFEAGPLTVQGDLATPSGAIALKTSGGALSQTTGTISASDTITIIASSAIKFGGTLAATGVVLDSTGAGVSENQTGESSTGVVRSTTLAVTAGGGAVDLNTVSAATPMPVGNQVGTLAASSATTDFGFADGTALSVQGNVSAPAGAVAITVTGGNLSQAAGTISALGTITLTSTGAVAFGGTAGGAAVAVTAAGDITQTAGTLSATTLAASSSGGSVALNLGNTVGTLEASSASKDFSFTNAGVLSVGGTVGGANVAVAVGAADTLTLGAGAAAGSLVAAKGGTVAITADGVAQAVAGSAISAPGGTVQIAPSTTGDGIAVGGVASPGTIAVALGALGINASTLRLGVPGAPADVGNVTFAAATDLTATVGALDVEISGGLSQTSGSTLKVGTLFGNLGTLTLNEPLNVITTLGALTATNAVSLTDSGPLDVAGGVSGASVALVVTQAGGALTLGADTITATGGGAVTLRADSLALGAGAVTASGGSVALASFATQPMAVGGATPTVVLPTLTASKLTLGAAGAGTTATTIALAEAVTLPASATLDLEATGAVSQAAIVSAGTLTGTIGSLDFSTSVNNVGTLGPLKALSGGVMLNDGGALTLGGTVSGTAVALSAGGDLTQKAGTLSATTLSAAASGGAVTLNLANTVGTLEASSATNGFSFTNAGALAVGGTVSGANVSVAVGAGDTLTLGAGAAPGSLVAATGGTVAITADGVAQAVVGSAISAPGGTVQIAPSTTGDGIAVGGVASTGTIAVALGSLSFTASTLRLGVTGAPADVGNVSFAAPTDLTATVGALDVEISGGVSQTTGSTLKVGALTGAAASVTLDEPTNAIGTLGPFTASGAISVVDGQPLTIAGAVGGSAVSLSVQGAVGAAITLGNGTVAGTLTATGAGAVTLLSDALLLAGAGTGDAITAHAGSVAIAPFHMLAMTVGGVTPAAQLPPTLDTAKLTLGAAGAGTTATSIAVDEPVVLTGVLDLESSGLVSQSAPVTAATLTGTVGSLAFATPGNVVTTLGPLTSKSGAVTLVDGRSLTVGGALSSAGDVTLTAQAGGATAGDLALGAPVGGGTVALTAAGAISQSAALSATTLLAAVSGGAATLNIATNLVGTLAASSAAGAFLLTDGEALTVSGAVSGSTVALTVASKGAALTFGPAADVIATAAAPVVSLSADAVSLSAPGAIVTAAGGTVEVAPFTTGADFGGTGGLLQLPTVVAQTLRVGAAGGVTTARNITFGGPFSTGTGTLDIEASGAVSQTAAGGVTAGLLTGTVGSLDFLSTKAANSIMNLGTVTAKTGAILLGDLLDLTITQGITATSVALSSGATLTQAAGTIHATDAAGSVSLTAFGALTLDGTVNAPSVSLISTGGDVSEAGGVIQAGLLTGSAGSGAATLATPSPAGAGNQVAQLGGFATKGTLSLVDGRALTVTDQVSSKSGDVLLTVNGGALTQNATLLSAGLTISALGTVALTASSDVSFGGALAAGTVSLASATGNISEALGASPPTGVIQAGVLTGSAPAGAATLNTASATKVGNQVGTLAAFATNGALNLADGQTLTVTNDVTSGAGAVTLSINGGGLTQTAGTIKAATTAAIGASGAISLAGVLDAPNVVLNSSGGDVIEAGGTILATVLTGSAPAGAATLDTASTSTTGNQIVQLGAFATSGTLSLIDGGSLTVTGALSSATKDVSLTAAAGTLSQDAGLTISAPGGAISLTAAGALSFGGTLAGGSVALVSQTADVSEALGATPPTGVIQTALLTGSALNGAALLNTPSPVGSGNLVAELGAFPTKTGFTLLDGEPLTIGVSITTSGNYILTSTSGTLTFAEGVTITAGQTIDLTASGGIAVGGTLHAAEVILTATGGDITEALGIGAPTGVIQTPLLTGTSTAGAALFDTPSPAGAGNQVAVLGPFSAKGDLTLLDGSSLTVSGALSSSAGGVALTANGGTLSQNAGLTIFAPLGTIALAASGDLAFGGTLAAADVSLVSGGSVTEALGAAAPTGVIQTAGTLTGSADGAAPASGAVLLNTPSPAGAGNQIANLGAFTANGPFTLLNGEALAVTGNVSSGADATLTLSAGGLTQAAATTIMAGGTLAATVAAGIAFSGTLAGTTVNLIAQGGDIDEAGGAVSATLLTGSASGQALLNAAGSTNLVAQLGSFATNGDLLLTDGEVLALTGNVGSKSTLVSLATSAGGITEAAGLTVSAPTSISLSSAGGIAFGGTLAAGQVSLVAMGGDVTETETGGGGATGVVLTALLTGSASGLAAFDAPFAPGAGNAVTHLGPFTTAGSFTLVDGGTLAVAAAVTSMSGDVTLADRGPAASLTVNAVVSAKGIATLASDGAIAVAASGAVEAGPLASLTANGGLTQAGLVTAASVTETAGGDIASSGTTAATSGPASLTADAAVTQTAGTISAAGGDVVVTAKGGFVTQGAGASILDTTPAQAIRLAASGGISFAGTLGAAGLVSLTASGGDVTETAPGMVDAATLSGSASGKALLETPSPAGAGNLVAGLAGFTTGGDFTLLDGEALGVSGTVKASAGTATAGNVTVTVDGGGLTVAADVAAAASLDLSASGAISQTAGAISAGGSGLRLAATAGPITQAPGAVISAPAAGALVSLDSGAGIAFGGTIATPGTISLTARSGDLTETAPGATVPSGVVLASLLTGSASGRALLDTAPAAGAANQVAVLGTFTSSGALTLTDNQPLDVTGAVSSSAGDVTLTTTGAGSGLTIAGSVSASGAAALISAGDIAQSGVVSGASASETAGGAITQSAGTIAASAGALTLTALGGGISQAALDTGMSVSETASAGITQSSGTIASAGALALTAQGGDIAQSSLVTGASVTETASGAIAQSAGTISASAGALTLTAQAGGISQGALVSGMSVSETAGGAITQSAGTIASAGALTLAAQGGDISQNGLVSGASVTETASGAITQPAGTIASAGALVLTAQTGSISQSGVASGASVTETAGAAITQSAGTIAATAGALALTAIGGGISESGSVSGASVTESAGGAITQSAGTIAATGGALALTALGGGISQSSGAVVSDAAAGQTVSLTASAGVAFGGLIATPGEVVLTAKGGDVSETAPGASAPTGVVQASLLSGAASGQALLDTPSPAGAGNQVGTLSAFSAGGALAVLDGVSLIVAGDATAGGPVALTSAGAITQTSGTILANGAALTLAAQGGAITQSAGAAIQAPGSGAMIGLTASTGVSLGGAVSTPGAVSLVARGGDVAEAGGVVLAGSLAASATGAVLLATPSPAGAGNLIVQLGSVSAAGDFMLADGEALTVSGSQTAANAAVTVNGGSLTQAGGTFAATGTLALTASGGIAFGGVLSAPVGVLTAQGGGVTEAPGGAALFGTLSGSAAGDVSLAAPAGNQVAQVGALSAGGALTLVDGQTLTVAGPVAAKAGPLSITLEGAGAGLTVNGSVTASGALALATQAGLTQAGTVTGASVTESAGGAIAQSGATTATIGDATLTAGAGIRQTGGAVASAAGNVALTAGGGIAFSGTVSAARTVTLTASAGDLVETAPGALLAATLTGSASGQALLNVASGNQVAQLGAFTTGGGFALTDGAPLLVSGALTARAGTAALTVNGAGDALTLASLLTAPTADLISTGGNVAETAGGLLSVARLTGSAGGAASLGAPNQVAQLGPYATGTGFALTDAAALNVTDSVSATAGPVSLSVTGAGAGLTQTAGTISAGGGAVTLTVAAGGFSQSAGATVSDTDAAGGVAVTAQAPIGLAGLIAGAGPVTLVSQTAGIVETGAGAVRAGSLTGSSAGATSLATASGGGFGNQVAHLGAFTSGGSFVLLDGTGLTVSGPLRATTLDIQTTAALTLSGGSITATHIATAADYATLLQTFPLPAGPAYDIYLRAASVSQTGSTVIDAGAGVQPLATAPQPTLRIDLASQTGTIALADLVAPATQIFLSLNNGIASGQIDVAGLHLATSPFAQGSASFTGAVAGRFGTQAASVATITPLRNGLYRINSCAVGSVNCILLSPILVPITNPVQDVEIGNTNNRQDDPDLILPNVGEQDY